MNPLSTICMTVPSGASFVKNCWLSLPIPFFPRLTLTKFRFGEMITILKWGRGRNGITLQNNTKNKKTFISNNDNWALLSKPFPSTKKRIFFSTLLLSTICAILTLVRSPELFSADHKLQRKAICSSVNCNCIGGLYP